MGENKHCKEKSDAHKNRAIKESTPIQRATTKATIFEGFKDGSEGVESNDITVFLWSGREWVDDWSGIHEELDAKLHQELHVTIFGSHGGNDETP